MITTRRSEMSNSVYETRAAAAGVDLLERPQSFEEFASVAPAVDESEQAQERRRNLQNLLNYDRYTEQSSSVIVEEQVEEVQASALADEDIRPTSTTMQFGDDIDQIRREMNRAQEEEKSVSYHLNGKGKLAVTLYALAVTVILALIVLNTGVLAGLSNSVQAKAAELDSTIARYEAIQQEIDSISNSDYIIDVAQNQYGMVKGN